MKKVWLQLRFRTLPLLLLDPRVRLARVGVAEGGCVWAVGAGMGAGSSSWVAGTIFVGAGVSGAGFSMVGGLLSFGGQLWESMIWPSSWTPSLHRSSQIKDFFHGLTMGKD